MSSLAFNITRKLEWMGRRLRWKDDAGEIKEWVSAMTALNCLLKEVEIEPCRDSWQPWSENDHIRGDKKGVRVARIRSQASSNPTDKAGHVGSKREWRSIGNLTEAIKIEPRNKPTPLKVKPTPPKVLPPRVQVEGDETGMNVDEVEMVEQVATKVTQNECDIEDSRGGRTGDTSAMSGKDLLYLKRRKMWMEVNNNASWRSTCCMEKIEENLFLCKKCRDFEGDDEMLFQHWVKKHDFAAKVTL